MFPRLENEPEWPKRRKSLATFQLDRSSRKKVSPAARKLFTPCSPVPPALKTLSRNLQRGRHPLLPPADARITHQNYS
jgi:hypothetical protein